MASPFLIRTLRALAWCAALAAGTAQAAAPAPGLSLGPCQLPGVAQAARCGVLTRPLDPARPQGPQIELHVAVLPALARRPLPDPVFFFAGGPGQSAIALAGQVSTLLGRFQNRRDLVLIDQRGTGRSAPLQCEDEVAPQRPLREQLDPAAQRQALSACRERLQRLPHGDLRFFTTPLASADAEAVRQALGLGPVNLVGGSYGTRAALDYLRQYPASVRRVVLDGVAPPDMVLMRAMAVDGQAAFDALLRDCETTPACARAYPALHGQWQQLLASLPRTVGVQHPFTGRPERLTLRADMLGPLLRLPLYAPALAAGLPLAIQSAAAGDFAPLLGLSSGLGGGRREQALAMGQHFSVVCSEDAPRLPRSTDPAGGPLGESTEALYRSVCADWPRGGLPPAFYTVPPARVPVLLLSGTVDPVTPPRHARRVAAALGPQALSIEVAQAGHGVMGLACMRELVYRFVDTPDAQQAREEAQAAAARCATQLPRPPAFVPPGVGAAAGEGAR